MPTTFLHIILTLSLQGAPSMAADTTVKLPPPDIKSGFSLEEAIAKRRSVRAFVEQDLSLKAISRLLWAGQGVTAKKGGFSFRAAPSAGALYPMETFAVKKDGIYRYVPQTHSLELHAAGDLRPRLAEAAHGQTSVSGAPLAIVLCSVYQRVTARYGERGIRYAHIEAGHIAQNIHLAAAALGLGSVPIGAFDDAKVKTALKLPKDCEPLYIIPVGRPAR
ncbi:MAG: SagB/ThcOx family dehydrogenase [Elusimicrobia bacterium]|nr:SagB/ThcOx family dehydrogenase [Elusimicrobiota bacterium]